MLFRSDEVFSRRVGNLKNAPFGELVDSIIKTSPSQNAGLKAGIFCLMGYEGDDDQFAAEDLGLDPVISRQAEPFVRETEHRTFYRNRHDRAQNVILTPRGIDLDYFLNDFRADEGGRIKAMYSFSKRFKAESAVLVRVDEDGLQVLRTLGIPHHSATHIEWRDGGDSLADLATVPAIALFSSPPVLSSLLTQPCFDPAVARMAVWVPVIFENSLAYCIFGYSQLVDLPRYLAQYIEVLPVDQPEE